MQTEIQELVADLPRRLNHCIEADREAHAARKAVDFVLLRAAAYIIEIAPDHVELPRGYFLGFKNPRVSRELYLGRYHKHAANGRLVDKYLLLEDIQNGLIEEIEAFCAQREGGAE